MLAVPHHVPIQPAPRRVFRETLVGLGAADLDALLLPS